MKKQIRQDILKQRLKLSQNVIQEKSLVIKKLLYSIPEFAKAKTVMWYYSVKNEVFTHNIIEECLGNKKVLLPKLILDEIKPCEIKSMGELVLGRYNIMEPICREQYSGEIDVIIVPGVAFDLQKNRIGTGKGYYDKFLSAEKTFKIGLAYEFQIVNKVPVDKTDVAMDLVITEKRVIK